MVGKKGGCGLIQVWLTAGEEGCGQLTMIRATTGGSQMDKKG